MKDINDSLVWERICNHAGHTFQQIRGKKFSYSITGYTLNLSTTNRSVSKKTIEQALEYVPLQDTILVQHLQAPSYLYAILMDDRIRNGLW